MQVAGDSDVPATELGFLLHKHPDRVQTFPTSQGRATVFYPEAGSSACRAVLHVDGAGARVPRDSARYVNDVAHAAGSRLVVAIGKVFGDALAGRCKHKPDLVDHRWSMTLTIPSVPLRARATPADLFGPLGWAVEVEPQELRPSEWGDSDYATVTLRGLFTVRDALRHVAILVPVLADDQHYFVHEPEIEKLDRLGADWLADHPLREAIVGGYLKGIRPLVDGALGRLSGDDPSPHPTPRSPLRESLAQQRIERVVELVRSSGARSVLDVGCGEGRLLTALAADPGLVLAGVDVSMAALGRAETALARVRGVELWQSSLVYADARCRGYDAAILMEVIEHVDLDRLPRAAHTVFDGMAPRVVIVTTPNREYNAHYGIDVRHPDHRFEFTRGDFTRWCDSVAVEYRYDVEIGGIGDPHPDHGTPTQFAVFTRRDVTATGMDETA